jgi:hypothetical protein
VVKLGDAGYIVVINKVKENRIKSTTIHYGLSRDIKPSEPPGCLVRRPDPRAPLFLSAICNRTPILLVCCSGDCQKRLMKSMR